MEKELEKWDKVIESKTKFLNLKLKQVWNYRDLVFLFVKKDIIIYYKQTILGPLWYLIQPLISSLMYMFIFGTLADIGTDNIPQILFYFSGTMLWTFFSDTFLQTANVFTDNKAIFSKVYFPRLVVPIASMLGQIIRLMIQFVLFIIFYLYFILKGTNIVVTWKIMLFPFLILWIGILGVGLGLIVSAITTKYRDIALILGSLVSLIMYATPVVYPLSEVPQNVEFIFYLNPMSAPLEIFRACFFNVGNMSVYLISASIGITVLLIFMGLVLFCKNEQTFVDVI